MPGKDSHAYRIVIWFTLNPEVEMSARDFASKFCAEQESMYRALVALERRGYLLSRLVPKEGQPPHVEFRPGPRFIEELER